jgi:hypothetical protein
MVVLNTMREYEPDDSDTVDEDNTSRPSTPTSPAHAAMTSENPSMPMTIRSLKRQVDHLLETPLSPHFRRCLATFIKGSLLQANTNILLKGNLEKTRRAESARAARKPKAW